MKWFCVVAVALTSVPNSKGKLFIKKETRKKERERERQKKNTEMEQEKFHYTRAAVDIDMMADVEDI